MINNPPPFKSLNSRIPLITPFEGRGFIDQGSELRKKNVNPGLKHLSYMSISRGFKLEAAASTL